MAREGRDGAKTHNFARFDFLRCPTVQSTLSFRSLTLTVFIIDDTLDMSGISPYHDAPHADPKPPATCKVVAAASLIRHTSIYANDDEFEDYMQPFSTFPSLQNRLQQRNTDGVANFLVKRVEKAQKNKVKIDQSSPLFFLNEWKSPINEDNLEAVTEPGKADAYAFGQKMRKAYGDLLPPAHLGKKHKNHKKEGKVPPFKIWSASSKRDVITSQQWIKGAFPDWQGGEDGDGDGKVISLVKVPNNDTNWANSLTPHKICPAFTKEAGKPEAQTWLENYGPPILERLQSFAPKHELVLDDITAMFMLCGYESVVSFLFFQLADRIRADCPLLMGADLQESQVSVLLVRNLQPGRLPLVRLLERHQISLHCRIRFPCRTLPRNGMAQHFDSQPHLSVPEASPSPRSPFA